jgi:hypothetical protein
MQLFKIEELAAAEIGAAARCTGEGAGARMEYLQTYSSLRCKGWKGFATLQQVNRVPGPEHVQPIPAWPPAGNLPLTSDEAGSVLFRGGGKWLTAMLCYGCRQTVRQWQEALGRVPGLRGVDSLQPERSAISEELNLAWARHEIISDNVDEVRGPHIDAFLGRAVLASHAAAPRSHEMTVKLRRSFNASRSVRAQLQQTA